MGTVPPEVPFDETNMAPRTDNDLSTGALISEFYGNEAAAGVTDRKRLRYIKALSQRSVHLEDDCHDMVQWLSIHMGVGSYRARKMHACAFVIDDLPLISHALETAVLSLDKVVELTRFAIPETERKLITWARKVSVMAIRNRAEELSAKKRDKALVDRFLRYRDMDEGFFFDGFMPKDLGVLVFSALEDKAAKLTPAPTDDEGTQPNTIEQRRLDALVDAVLDTSSLPTGAHGATQVFVHARLSELGLTNATSDGITLSDDMVERITCDARLRFVLADEEGNALGIGRASRTVPDWVRQAVLKQHDFSCTFPGCDSKRGLEVHHFVHWSNGGPTDPENLGPMCRWHHMLIHDHDWRAYKGTKGTVIWYRPNGTEYIPGPAPPLLA